MMRTCSFLMCLFVLAILACEKTDPAQKDTAEVDNKSPSNDLANQSMETDTMTRVTDSVPETSIDESTVTSFSIKLRENSKIYFGEEALTLPYELVPLIRRAAGDDSRNVELSIEVDDVTEVRLLNDVILGLHLAGYYNVFLVSKREKTRVPRPEASSSGEELDSVKVTFVTSQSGQLNGMKLDVNGEVSMIESQELENVARFAAEKLESLRPTADGNGVITIRDVELELIAPPIMRAHEFSDFCQSISKQSEKLVGDSLRIRIWPFGYPRETPLNIELSEPFDVETEDGDGIEPQAPLPELKQLEIDG